MNNAAFFSAGNKNFISGADTALGIDGLTKGEQTFMDLVDTDGKPTGVMPSIMLVPTALSAMGTQLYKSVELRDTTANTKFPVVNPHQGKFRIEVSRYLANALYTGNSAKAWYLLADPSDLPVIEMAFLNGQEAPTVETSDADFNPPTCSASGCVGTTTSPPRRQPAGPARRCQEQGRGVNRAPRSAIGSRGARRRASWQPRRRNRSASGHPTPSHNLYHAGGLTEPLRCASLEYVQKSHVA